MSKHDDKMMNTGHYDRNKRAIRSCSFVVVDNGRMGQVFWSGTFLRWQISFPGGSSEPLNRYESKDLLVK
jgi:hypothetical protein